MTSPKKLTAAESTRLNKRAVDSDKPKAQTVLEAGLLLRMYGSDSSIPINSLEREERSVLVKLERQGLAKISVFTLAARGRKLVTIPREYEITDLGKSMVKHLRK